MNRIVCCPLIAAVLAGCGSRLAPVVPVAPASTALPLPYIDLQAGWRLRVVTPLTKSGTYQVGLASGTQTSGTQQFAAGPDFLGYELSFYHVQRKGRNGVRIQFTSGEQTRDGITTSELQPRAPLFQLSRRARYVRLLYLTRVSRSDHNMAVIAAAREQLLARITEQVQTDPQACQDSDETFCRWIPVGVAVLPERRTTQDASTWEPAH